MRFQLMTSRPLFFYRYACLETCTNLTKTDNDINAISVANFEPTPYCKCIAKYHLYKHTQKSTYVFRGLCIYLFRFDARSKSLERISTPVQ